MHRFLVHDLAETEAADVFGALPKEVICFAARPRVRHCVGCFGCWIKTPGHCVIRDHCPDTPAILGASRELILVSRNLYGGFSPEVKAVLDRSIGYVLPFFRMVEGEMHHTLRYEQPLTITAHFYGEEISEEERAIATECVRGNALNLGAEAHRVVFHESLTALKGAVL